MWNQQWHTNFCVAYTRNPEFLPWFLNSAISIEIEYTGVISKLISEKISTDVQREAHLSRAQALIISSPTLQPITNVLCSTKLLGEEGSWNSDITAKQNEISGHMVTAPTKQDIAENKRWRNCTGIILERRRLPHYNVKCLDCVVWWVPLLTVEELLQVVQICPCCISNCHFVLTAFQ